MRSKYHRGRFGLVCRSVRVGFLLCRLSVGGVRVEGEGLVVCRM